MVIKVFKMYVEKDGKQYINFYNAWKHKEKVYLVRVFPQFVSDFRLLVSNAVEVDNVSKISDLL